MDWPKSIQSKFQRLESLQIRLAPWPFEAPTQLTAENREAVCSVSKFLPQQLTRKSSLIIVVSSCLRMFFRVISNQFLQVGHPFSKPHDWSSDDQVPVRQKNLEVLKPLQVSERQLGWAKVYQSAGVLTLGLLRLVMSMKIFLFPGNWSWSLEWTSFDDKSMAFEAD